MSESGFWLPQGYFWKCSIPLSWNNSSNYTFLFETCVMVVKMMMTQSCRLLSASMYLNKYIFCKWYNWKSDIMMYDRFIFDSFLLAAIKIIRFSSQQQEQVAKHLQTSFLKWSVTFWILTIFNLNNGVCCIACCLKLSSKIIILFAEKGCLLFGYFKIFWLIYT